MAEEISVNIGDTVTTNTGNIYKIGDLQYEDGEIWLVPEGADDFTYWIPIENVTSVTR